MEKKRSEALIRAQKRYAESNSKVYSAILGKSDQELIQKILNGRTFGSWVREFIRRPNDQG